MLDEWVRVRLKVVEMTLAHDPGADVRELCESIAATSISLDEGETSRSRRCTAEALEYLRQTAKGEHHGATRRLRLQVCQRGERWQVRDVHPAHVTPDVKREKAGETAARRRSLSPPLSAPPALTFRDAYLVKDVNDGAAERRDDPMDEVAGIGRVASLAQREA